MSAVSQRTERFRSNLRDSPSVEENDDGKQQSSSVSSQSTSDTKRSVKVNYHADPAACSVSRIERNLRYAALVAVTPFVAQQHSANNTSPFAKLLRDASAIVSSLDDSLPKTPPNALTGASAAELGGGALLINSSSSGSSIPSPPRKTSTAKQPPGKIPHRVLMPGMPSQMPTLPPAASSTSSTTSSVGTSSTSNRPNKPKLEDSLQLVADAARALPVKAVSLLEAAILVNSSCLVAKAELGLCLLYGHGVNANVTKALQLFDECMTCQHPGVMLAVGKCLRDGVGVAVDFTAGIHWIYQSANLGYLPAMHELGEMYEEGLSIQNEETGAPDSSSTVTTTTGSSRPGHLVAPSVTVLDKDLVQSFRWYKAAAEAGYADSQLNLAKLFMLSIADGVEEKADYWLKQAAKNGSLEAAGLLKRKAS